MEMSEEALAAVEALLRKEIEWTVRKGPGWDPYVGASFFQEG